MPKFLPPVLAAYTQISKGREFKITEELGNEDVIILVGKYRNQISKLLYIDENYSRVLINNKSIIYKNKNIELIHN